LVLVFFQSKLYRKLLNTKGGRRVAGGLMKVVGTKISTNHLFQRDYILLDLMDAVIKARPNVTVQPTYLLSHFDTPGKC
jgi:hypothetical protein